MEVADRITLNPNQCGGRPCIRGQHSRTFMIFFNFLPVWTVFAFLVVAMGMIYRKLSRVEAAGLAPTHDADARSLVRRLYFDLLGLPPSIEDVERFVAAHEQDDRGRVRAGLYCVKDARASPLAHRRGVSFLQPGQEAVQLGRGNAHRSGGEDCLDRGSEALQPGPGLGRQS